MGGLIFTATFTVLFGAIQCGGFAAGIGNVLKAGVALSPLTGVLCMIFSCVVTVVVSAFTKKLDEKILYEAFNKPIENEIK